MIQTLPAISYRAFRVLQTRRVLLHCDRIPYNYENVPLKKLLNWLILGASFYAKPERPWGPPTQLQVEPTAHCNLKCALCPTTEGLGRPAGHMSPDLFQRLIDEVGDYLFLILLWDWGEPFLNPHLYDMIAYAKRKGIKTVSSSNGHIFAQEGHADRVVRSGLDSLIFALDGVSQETYERYRQGGNLETVLRGIREVVAKKRALNSTTPLINLRMVVMEHNQHEIPRLKELAESLGVDVVSFKTLNTYSSGSYGNNSAARDRFSRTFVPRESRYERFSHDPATGTPIRLRHNPCKGLWNAPTIHWDGAVCPCTFDYAEKYALGDLKTASFRDIWSGHPYRRMRRDFRTNWGKIPLCGECTYAYEGGSCNGQTIAETLFFDRGQGTLQARQVVSSVR